MKQTDTSLHLDADIRIANIRCAGFIFKEDQLLIIHRIYKGREYYVIPGGHMQQGETKIETLERELMEETNLKVKNIQQAYEFINFVEDVHDHYFTCEWESGEAKVGGEEAIKNSKENFYELLWVKFSDIENYDIKPELAKLWLLESFLRQD